MQSDYKRHQQINTSFMNITKEKKKTLKMINKIQLLFEIVFLKLHKHTTRTITIFHELDK